MNAGPWEEMDGESSGGGVAGEDSRGSKKSSPLSSKRLREVGESSSSLQLESGKNTLVAFVCNNTGPKVMFPIRQYIQEMIMTYHPCEHCRICDNSW